MFRGFLCKPWRCAARLQFVYPFVLLVVTTLTELLTTAGHCTPNYEVRPPLDAVLRSKADSSTKKAKIDVGLADDTAEALENVEQRVDNLAASLTEFEIR